MSKPGTTTFYVVTGKGLFAVSAKEADLEAGHHAASPLFHRTREFLTMMGQESFISRYKQPQIIPALGR